MTVILDPTLQSNQDGRERNPAIEVISSEFENPIPFQGNSFGISDSAWFSPQMMTLSDGRLYLLYVDSNYDIQGMYTDTDRAQWTQVDLSELGTPYAVHSVNCVELPDGNIGVVMLTTSVGDWHIRYATITLTGTTITGNTLIEDLSNTYDYSGVFVTLLSNGTYNLVYAAADESTPDYKIYRRTATTWGTFGAQSAISLGTLNTAREVANPSLFETEEGDLFLFFDYVTSQQDTVTIKNIFSSISTDYGENFAEPEGRTSYTTFGTSGLDPVMVQKSNRTSYLVFYETVNVLHMDNSVNNHVYNDNCNFGDTLGGRALHINDSDGKAVLVYGHSWAGTKCIAGIAVIDMATWSIDKTYYKESIPKLDRIFGEQHCWHRAMHGDGTYMAVHTNYDWHDVIAVLNYETNTITTYVIGEPSIPECPSFGIVNYNLARNVDLDTGTTSQFFRVELHNLIVDADEQRLYCYFVGGYHRGFTLHIGYIDLTEVADGEGKYSMNWIAPNTGLTYPYKTRWQLEVTDWGFVRDTDRNYHILHTGGNLVQSPQTVVIFDGSNNCAIVKQYISYTNNIFPYYGLRYCVVRNGCLYGSFAYNSFYPYTDQRGLCKVDYINDTIQFYQPGYATQDQYWFYDFAVDPDSNHIWMACPEGVARFNVASGGFSLFNSDTLPGFTPSGTTDEQMFLIGYDSVNNNVIASGLDYWDTFAGIIMFSEYGSFNKLKYIPTYKAGTWQWQPQADLSLYSTELQPTVTVDPDDTMWTVWSHDDWENGYWALYWDNDLYGIDVTDDITGSVLLHWALKRQNSCSFTLANGHLYDPQNLLSAKNIVGQKGRRISVRIGEVIGDYTYWTNQGIYITDNTRMGYQRGRHPTLQIQGTGLTGIWDQQQVAVSQLYEGAEPHTVVADLIDSNTQWNSQQYDLTDKFDDAHGIHYQWIDKSLYSIIEEICDHFFYAMFETADGIFTCKKVDLTQAVDHEYTDSMQIMQFSPDDNFSDFTNRVRVIGESDDFTEVLHNEEMITSRAGSIGWWVKKTEETIYYSEDRKRQCRYPRLNITQSPKEYGLLLDQISQGKGGIKISYKDPQDHYVTVEIECPDLSAALATSIAIMIILGSVAVACDWGRVCGLAIWGLAIAASVVLYILAAIANYNYELWARPVGKVKLTIQAVADDTAFQRRIGGEVVTAEITDALCQTVAECQRVADGNLAMIAAQRKRLTFNKLAHLQDELLDKIKVYHPYSGEGMEILVVGLKRTYSKGKGVFDQITGWRYVP